MKQPDPPSAAGNPDVRSFVAAPGVTLGEILRQARERQALTLEEVARRTKLPRRHLEALERNSLAGLPPGMYQRAEVRAYADAIGLDPQAALIALGRAQSAAIPAADARPPAVQPIRREKRRPARLALLTVVLLAVPIGAASFLWLRESVGTVTSPAPAVEDKVVPTSLRPGADTEPRTGGATGGATDAGSATPAPGGNDLSPQVVEYPDLRVLTEPAGARVTVDGVGWGQSPLTIRALTPGTRLVRVTLDGYAAQERHVEVSRDTPRTTVRITLKTLR